MGILAALGLRVYMLNIKKETTRTQRTVKLVATARPVTKGETLERDMLTLKDVPEDLVSPRNHIQEYQIPELLGMRPVVNVSAGDILLWSMLIGPTDVKSDVAERLRPGERALTLKVDQVSGVAGLLLPGSRVDIYGTFELQAGPGAGTGPYTRPLLFNVPVLAVDNQTTMLGVRSDRRLQQGGYSSVTVGIVPRAAHLLIFAQEHGRVTLVLRKPEDGAIEPVTEILTQDRLNAISDTLIEEQRTPLPEAPVPGKP
jgi:pilus assembly protein CpaB